MEAVCRFARPAVCRWGLTSRVLPSVAVTPCIARVWAVLAVGMVFSRVVMAQDGDGLYNRLDRDLTLSAEASAGGWVGRDTRPTVGVTVRARYLDEVGVVLGYDRAVTGDREDAVWTGVDFRPLMLGRWVYDLEGDSRLTDLIVDSIGLDLGVAWLRPGEVPGEGSGFGFVLGTGVDLPLTWRNGDAVSLRVSVRWISAQRWDVQGTGASDNAVVVSAGVVFRTMVDAGLDHGRR